MASSSKRRQTFAKMTRERAVKEKRELKAEKKEARKLAAAAELAGETMPSDELVDEDPELVESEKTSE